MCGIAGILGRDASPVREDEIRAMCAAMAHRGPDGEGVYLGTGVGLGMRRLRIIDLETGDQPIRNENGSVWVVFNGEIYNYRELRSELEARGHRFYTATDTECIVHLYEEEQERCVERLRGMFTIAVWDEGRQKLLLARDRLGIKPLYYAEVAGRLVFASELKAVLQLPEVDRKICWDALGHLLACLVTPSRQSIVEGVVKLPPAHRLIASPGRPIRVERYWDVPFEPARGRSADSLADELRGLLEESVRLHLASDVPLGAFLSGGIDSSAVVATMARLVAEPVRTFSIGFAEADFDEREHARLVARSVGAAHHELVLEPDVLSIVEDLAYHLDEPFGDSSAIPTYMVSKLAAEHVTVVLSGDGGDELFAGYDAYAVEGRERVSRFMPSTARRAFERLASWMPDGMRGRNLLRHFSRSGHDRYLDASTLFQPEERAAILTRDALDRIARCDPWREPLALLGKGAGGHWLSALQYLDLHRYLPLDILAKVDRMSMAHSIEARVPLLDHVLVEFAARVPPELQIRHGTTKWLFKRALRGLVPDAILDRPKHGFAIPLGHWFRGRLEDFVLDLLLSRASRERGIFEPQAVERLLRSGGRDHLGLQIWTLISFELWCRTFLDARPLPQQASLAAPQPA